MAARDPMNLDSLLRQTAPAEFLAVAIVNRANSLIGAKERYCTRIWTNAISGNSKPIDILRSLKTFGYRKTQCATHGISTAQYQPG